MKIQNTDDLIIQFKSLNDFYTKIIENTTVDDIRNRCIEIVSNINDIINKLPEVKYWYFGLQEFKDYLNKIFMFFDYNHKAIIYFNNYYFESNIYKIFEKYNNELIFINDKLSQIVEERINWDNEEIKTHRKPPYKRLQFSILKVCNNAGYLKINDDSNKSKNKKYINLTFEKLFYINKLNRSITLSKSTVSTQQTINEFLKIYEFIDKETEQPIFKDTQFDSIFIKFMKDIDSILKRKYWVETKLINVIMKFKNKLSSINLKYENYLNNG